MCTVTAELAAKMGLNAYGLDRRGVRAEQLHEQHLLE